MIAVDSGLSFLMWRLSDVILISMLLTGKYFGSICSGLGTDGFCLEWIRSACFRQGLLFQMQAVAASDALRNLIECDPRNPRCADIGIHTDLPWQLLSVLSFMNHCHCLLA